MLRRLLDGWPLVIVLIFIVAVSELGDASRRPCRNYRFGEKIRARFDPHKCWDVDEAKWKCNDVEFDPTEIRSGGR